MRKIGPKTSVFIVIVIFVIFFGYMSGYRFDGLSAAKANSSVLRDSVLADQVDYEWGSFYIFDSPEKPITAISMKTFDFLWTSRSSIYHYHRDDPIRTIGGGSMSTPGKTATVFSIKADDPDISYIEAGPEGERLRIEAEMGEPITFAWEDSVQLDKLKAQAFAEDGKLLYEYRYPTTITGYINLRELRWYPPDQTP